MTLGWVLHRREKDMKHDSFNESAEMYLKTVSELAVAGDPVPISALAGRLGVSPVSATEMVHRLQDHGLVDHRPYKGISLTADGYRQAADVIRSHRLWERFLVDQLDLPWDKAHAFACRLEHASDPQVTEALDRFLGRPATCPHGNPIPTATGTLGEPDDQPLADMNPTDSAIVTRVHPESDDLLTYLADLDLMIGCRVTLLDIVPFGGPLVLQVNGEQRYMGREAAERVYIQYTEAAQ